MNIEVPEYLCLNPIFKFLKKRKKNVVVDRQNLLYNEFLGGIKMKLPLKLYMTIKDETNIKYYYLKDLIETSFQ